jgi:hypothetical protein
MALKRVNELFRPGYKYQKVLAMLLGLVHEESGQPDSFALTYDITTMAQQFNPGGLVPSLGLDVFHAERIFQEAATFPLIVAKDNGSPKGFYQQLIAYIESGFPLFGVMNARSHAIAIIGYERKNPVLKSSGFPRHEWEEIKSLVVVDDNYLPYLAIPI